MPEFTVTYTVTIERTYNITVKAKDQDSAEAKIAERLGKIANDKYIGDLEDEAIDYEIESVDEV